MKSPRVARVYIDGLQSLATLLLSPARDVAPDWPATGEEGQVIALALIGGASQTEGQE